VVAKFAFGTTRVRYTVHSIIFNTLFLTIYLHIKSLKNIRLPQATVNLFEVTEKPGMLAFFDNEVC
jgi:hypothetical protein